MKPILITKDGRAPVELKEFKELEGLIGIPLDFGLYLKEAQGSRNPWLAHCGEMELSPRFYSSRNIRGHCDPNLVMLERGQWLKTLGDIVEEAEKIAEVAGASAFSVGLEVVDLTNYAAMGSMAHLREIQRRFPIACPQLFPKAIRKKLFPQDKYSEISTSEEKTPYGYIDYNTPGRNVPPQFPRHSASRHVFDPIETSDSFDKNDKYADLRSRKDHYQEAFAEIDRKASRAFSHDFDRVDMVWGDDLVRWPVLTGFCGPVTVKVLPHIVFYRTNIEGHFPTTEMPSFISFFGDCGIKSNEQAMPKYFFHYKQ